MVEKNLAKRILKKQGIKDIDSANTFMDKIVNNLTDYDLKRAYDSAKKKHDIKQTNHTLYMKEYFMKKCKERNIYVT